MLKQKQPFSKNFSKKYVTRDFGRVRTGDIQLTGLSRLIIVFEYCTQKHVIFDFGPSHSAM